MLMHQKCRGSDYWWSRARSRKPTDYMHSIREEQIFNAGPDFYMHIRYLTINVLITPSTSIAMNARRFVFTRLLTIAWYLTIYSFGYCVFPSVLDRNFVIL
ncbi:uncharacterized protein LOC143427497 [Xylocopa sonorina]|uniref:uncharacterized protein LOC143427497 n=1 Tax=Xylocopa sonorina TaxID=1818115 RepID=UPI00403A8CFE